ncbi:hypothetical protein NWP10_09205, partial [Micrococcus sp. HG099]|nr:hypothetical protein [Micrococcus sp. HG099]
MGESTLYWIIGAIIVVLLILIILSVVASRRRRAAEAEAAEAQLERRRVTPTAAGVGASHEDALEETHDADDRPHTVASTGDDDTAPAGAAAGTTRLSQLDDVAPVAAAAADADAESLPADGVAAGAGVTVDQQD